MADGNIFLFPKYMKSSVIFNEELYFWGYKAYFNRLHRQMKPQNKRKLYHPPTQLSSVWRSRLIVLAATNSPSLET